ncbi:aminoacyltransferase [Candidatus Saccharibacteria bacterium]|nr:aminoacyltransferase [Candidatus Saccharibacteria bacterium]
MTKPNLTEITNQTAWDTLITNHHGHPMQLWGWGDTKVKSGNWHAYRLQSTDGLAQILIRRLPKPFTAIAYCPRGPVITGSSANFLTELKKWCKSKNCLELKIEAATPIDFPPGFRKSPSHILINTTATINLQPELPEIMASYSSKTRQYIKKASRDGITVRPATEADLATIYALYAETARRAHFAIHPASYYNLIFQKIPPENTQLLVAEYENPEHQPQIVAFLWNIITETAFELYGGINEIGQRLHANHLLKQTAIEDAKNRGANLYDMNGLLNDGISSFKLGFGQATTLPPTMDAPLSPLYYPYELLFRLRRLRHILPRR